MADIVIAHDTADIRLVNYLTEGVQNLGLTVWYAGKDKKAQDLGQAVLNCKVFLPLFNETAEHNNRLRDTVALAYVSNKAIVPVATRHFRKVNQHLDTGLKLILARINWIFFVKKEEYEVNLQKLTAVINDYLAREASSSQTDGEQQTDDNSAEVVTKKRLNIMTQTSLLDDCTEEDASDTNPSEQMSRRAAHLYTDFWNRHFDGQTEVPYVKFRDQFLNDYSANIVRRIGEDKKNLYINLMYKDVFNLSKTVKQSAYNAFIGNNDRGDPDVFYHTLHEYAVSYFATREVFDMESTVRLTAIQNLGRFHTEGVLGYLMKLTRDTDPNVRAIAALALAKTGKKKRKIEECIMSMLKDEDRLVRESCCLSLAYMKCTRATSHILQLWRNDPIKQVREAAEIAINRMGGEEAQENIKITQVLSQEMAQLKSRGQLGLP